MSGGHPRSGHRIDWRSPASIVSLLRREWPSVLMLLSIAVIHLISFFGRRARGPVVEAAPVKEPLPEWMMQDLQWDRLLLDHAGLALALIVLTIVGLIMLLVGIFHLASLIDQWRRGEVTLWPGRLTFRAPWGAWDLGRVAIRVAFVVHVVVVAQTVWELWHPERQMDDHARMLVHTMLVDLLVVGGVWGLIREHRLSWHRIGLSWHGLGALLREAATGYVTAMPVLLGALLATMAVVRLIGWEPEPQPVFELLYAEPRSSVVWYAMWMVAFLGPFAEEVMFRGVAYTTLKGRVGIGWAIVLSGVLFALLHVDPVGFVPIAVLGMLLAYLYERTGSLVPSIAVHVVHNSVMVGIVYLVRAAVQASA